MTGFPFLDRIPVDERLTAINELAAWQKRHHPEAPELDIETAVKTRRWPASPDISVYAPDWEEEAEIETLKEMQSNTDIKERMN